MNDVNEEFSNLADPKQSTQEERLIKKEMFQCYMDYVKELPEKYNEVYLLTDLEGMTPREISEKLSLPLGTVKIRLHRARNRIAGVLKENCTCYHNSHGELLAGPKELSAYEKNILSLDRETQHLISTGSAVAAGCIPCLKNIVEMPLVDGIEEWKLKIAAKTGQFINSSYPLLSYSQEPLELRQHQKN